MKSKIYSLTLIVSVLFSFTSCMDEDTSRSYYLSGEWQGDFGMYYEYKYRGRVYTFDSYDTDIKFIPQYEYATYGDGYQVDWYTDGPYRYLSYHFLWEIRDGVIYLTYPGNHEWDTEIYNYSLSDRYFSGRFGNSNERFHMAKIRGYYDWNPYYGNDFGWDRRNDWNDYYPYYAGTRCETDNDTTGIIVRRGCRMEE